MNVGDVPAVNWMSDRISDLRKSDFQPRGDQQRAWGTVVEVLRRQNAPQSGTEFAEPRNHVGLLKWKFKPWEEESVVADSLPHIGCIRLKGAVVPWGGDYLAVPRNHVAKLASEGQSKVWDLITPGCITLFLHLGTARPGKNSRRKKNQRKGDGEGTDKIADQRGSLEMLPQKVDWTFPSRCRP